MNCFGLGRQRCQECNRRVRRVEPSEANSALPRPAPPRPAAPHPAPLRPVDVRVLDSTGERNVQVGCVLGGPTCRRPVLLLPARLRCPAVHCPVSTSHCYVRVFPGNALHEKRFTKTKKRLPIGQQRGTKSAFRLADKPFMNWMFWSSIGLHRISFVRASGGSFRTGLHDALESTRDGCLLGEPIRRRPSCSAQPRRPSMRRPDSTRPCHVRALNPTIGFIKFPSIACMEKV